MRIDCHVHGDPAKFEGDPAAYVEECRAGGIDRVVLIMDREICEAALERFGDFVIPVARVPMDDCSSREVEAAIEAGMKGIKFIRPRAPYGDERYWPLYEKIEELGSVAVYHTGYLGFRKREEKPASMEHMRAAQVEIVSRRFPDMKILMSHFGNPWWEEAWKVMWSKANVYADLCGGTAINRSKRMWAETFAPDGELDEKSISKLLFGTDVRYLHNEEHGYAPYIEFHEKLFDMIGLTDEQREAVNSGTAVKLFGLGE